MGSKGVISSHATLYARTERNGATQIAARSTSPISWETPPLHPRTLCERTVLVKVVAEGRFTKHTRGSLHFVALSFIKKKFGRQMEIDSGTS